MPPNELGTEKVLDLILSRLDTLDEHVRAYDRQALSREEFQAIWSEITDNLQKMADQMASLGLAIERLVSANYVTPSDLERRLAEIQVQIAKLQERDAVVEAQWARHHQETLANRANRYAWVGLLSIIPALYYLWQLLHL